VNHLARSDSHRGTSTHPDNTDVGRRVESTKRAALYYLGVKEKMLFLTNPGFTT